MKPPACLTRAFTFSTIICLLTSALAAGPSVKAARRIEVKMEDLKFHPDSVDVAPGDTVVWVNNDDVEHGVKADDGSFNSGRLGRGRTYEYTFDKPGRFVYHDDLHPRMHGVVVVAAK